MPSGYPDWTWPMVWVLQEGELWPISDWVAKQGQFKSWLVHRLLAGGATDDISVYQVPVGKVLYLVTHIASADGRLKTQLYYVTPTVTVSQFFTLAYDALVERFIPPVKLTAGKHMSIYMRNMESGNTDVYQTIQAYEQDV